MEADFRKTARRLWRTAPYWRYSVIGASVFSALFLIHVLTEGGSSGVPTPAFYPAPPPPPEPTPDPMTEGHLRAYESTYASAGSFSPGRRCEALADAFSKLSAGEVQAGRNVRASSASRIHALAEGQECQADIGESDNRFTDLSRALIVSEGQPDFPAVSAALGALNAFDQSRARYEAEAATISHAQALLEAEAESQKRIGQLAKAVTALQVDPVPASYVHAADALKALTDADRARLTPDQDQLVAVADDAADKVEESRTRLANVALRLSKKGVSQDLDVDSQLIEALANITDFDEALATPEQKEMLGKARAAALPVEWTRLSQALSALDKDKSVANYSAVASIYDWLRQTANPSKPDQQRLLAAAQGAADFLPASDNRIEAMSAAASAWRQIGVQARDPVLSALRTITSFDRMRFTTSQSDDWDLLNQATTILRGPEIGLTVVDKDRMPIFVFTNDETDQDQRFVNSLIDALNEAGYRLTNNRDEAVLLTEVSIHGVSDPVIDMNSGPVASYTATASLDVATRWVSDDSILFSDAISTTADSDFSGVKVAALLKAIEQIVTDFRQVTTP
jgi:hypothetical protein